MDWLLVITVLMNNQLQTVEVKPFGEWMCAIVSSSIKDKSISVTNYTVDI